MNDCRRLLLNSPSGKLPENILGGVILVYNRYSKQSVCNLTKRRTFCQQEILENRCLLTSSYAPRNVDCIPRIKIKHIFFKNNFFQSAIIEWNKLVLLFGTLKVRVFSKSISWNFLDPPREVFLIATTQRNKTNDSTFRWISHLREHKFNNNFQNCINPLCRCGMDIESSSHFSLPYLMIKESLSWAL